LNKNLDRLSIKGNGLFIYNRSEGGIACAQIFESSFINFSLFSAMQDIPILITYNQEHDTKATANVMAYPSSRRTEKQ
jgi:hypothetical protein